ncbi:Hypothetical protein CINCED_3A025610 [Cinara cedri]|uniref:Uncharacterized protein n=1 Tax=Cinara cedri TaxID=506608 RepID=A0A5E4NG92_9HEMI|nr:Hypothetical protein CINCED_3A025610 [Cinara cedri]
MAEGDVVLLHISLRNPTMKAIKEVEVAFTAYLYLIIKIKVNLFGRINFDPDLEVQIIDGTIIRAHACTAEYKKDSGAQEALGRSKDGLQLLLIKKMILHRLKH